MRTLMIPLLFLALLVACDDGQSSSNTNNTNNTNNVNNTSGESLVVEVIDEGVRAVNGLEVDYSLLRLTCGDKRATYAFTAFPTGQTDPAPAVLATMPYDVIDWTGEEVDTQAAQTTAPVTLDDLLNTAFVHRYHGFGFAAAFGRFYTGDSIRNEVDDMTCTLRYVAEHARVDASRIGVYGGSWGGFEALYTAAYAPTGVVPAAGVALFPVSDVEAMVEHVVTIPERVTSPSKVAEYQAFYAPYLDRIFQTTGGAPGEPGSDYSGFTLDDLVLRLDTPFLIWHEMHDTLVPFTHSEALAQAVPNLITPAWYRYAEPLDLETESLGHGYFPDVVWTFLLAHLHTRLADPSQSIVLLHFPAAFHDFMVYLRELEATAYDSAFIIPTLLSLADERVTMFSGEGEPMPSGRALLADELTQVWCLDPPLTAEEVVPLLESGELPVSQCP